MYEIRERIGSSRTDTNGIIKLASALDIIQDSSLFWLESEPSFHAFLKSNNLGMFLASRQVDIRRLPVYGELITARTSIYDCRSFSGYRNTVLYGEDGMPCVLTWGIGVFVDINSGKMIRLPSDITNSVAMDPKVDMDYLDKKIALPALPARRAEAVTVRRSDIDFYHHMNNARYVERALEFIPSGFIISRLRIEYRTPAKEGDLLHPHVIEAPDGQWYILLTDDRETPYTVMAFS